MTIIEAPPNPKDIFKKENVFDRIFNVPQIQGLRELIHKANDQYYYWSDLKHRVPREVDVSAEEIWAYIRLGRSANSKITPMTDIEGKPFQYWLPDCLHRVISEIDKWSGGIITTDQPGFPSKEKYIISSLMDEAIASSQLEGASTEYKAAKELLRTGRKPLDKNEKMIVNNWEAMQFIRNQAKKKFTLPMVRELHSILTQGTLEHPEESGNLRKNDDIEVRYRGEVVFIPPKASEVEGRLIKLLEFASIDDEDNWIHPVIKSAMIHFWMAYIHPFVDGNGRTARALMYWYLLSRNYTLFQYLSISKHFLIAPGQYVKAYLHTEHDDNDLTYFLVYNLNSMRNALVDLREYIEKKTKEISSVNQLLTNYRGLNYRQKSLVYHSIQHSEQVYTVEAHKNTHGIAYDTARKDLMALALKGFLRKEKEGKRLFLFFPSGRAIEKLREKK